MNNNRRRRLIELFASPQFKGDRAKLIKESGYSKGRIAQFFDDDQAFGELAASNLATRLGLPSDYFESDAGELAGMDPDTVKIAHLYQSMTQEERARWRLLYLVARDGKPGDDDMPADDISIPPDNLLGGSSGFMDLDEPEAKPKTPKRNK